MLPCLFISPPCYTLRKKQLKISQNLNEINKVLRGVLCGASRSQCVPNKDVMEHEYPDCSEHEKHPR